MKKEIRQRRARAIIDIGKIIKTADEIAPEDYEFGAKKTLLPDRELSIGDYSETFYPGSEAKELIKELIYLTEAPDKEGWDRSKRQGLDAAKEQIKRELDKFYQPYGYVKRDQRKKVDQLGEARKQEEEEKPDLEFGIKKLKERLKQEGLSPEERAEIKLKIKDEKAALEVAREEALKGPEGFGMSKFGPTGEYLGPTSGELSEETRIALDSLEMIEPTFSEPEIFKQDISGEFTPDSLNQAMEWSKMKAWVTIPSESRRHGIPYLYYINPLTMTEHDKYFGIKAGGKYINTPVSAVLSHAAIQGLSKRDLSVNGKKLIVPKDHPMRSYSGDYIVPLDQTAERELINASTQILQDANNKPSNIRRVNYDTDEGGVQYTTAHSRGIREIPGRALNPYSLEAKIEGLDRAFGKGLEAYPELQNTVSEFVGSLSANMESLVSEHHEANKYLRFLLSKRKGGEGGSKEAVRGDILKQDMLRLIIQALTESDGPFSDTPLSTNERVEVPK